MNRVFHVELSTAGIRTLTGALKDYQKWLERKTDELARRLADIGVQKAEINFSAAYYDGEEDHTLEVIPVEPNCYTVRASGETVLFVEFGTGLVGYGHPEPNGYGAGTYPGKGHWDDPNGWYYGHGKHSYGNPPNMPMYNTVKELELDLERIVKEVFN